MLLLRLEGNAKFKLSELDILIPMYDLNMCIFVGFGCFCFFLFVMFFFSEYSRREKTKLFRITKSAVLRIFFLILTGIL